MTTASPPRRVYAGLVSRVAALTVDVVLLTLATMAVATLPALAYQQVSPYGAPQWLSVGSRVAAAVLPWLYFTVCWWLTGQTVGDLATGVVVRRRDGRSLGLARAGLRAAAGLALAPLWLVGLFAVLWDRQRRAWHDRVFRTVVRYAGASGQPAGRPR